MTKTEIINQFAANMEGEYTAQDLRQIMFQATGTQYDYVGAYLAKLYQAGMVINVGRVKNRHAAHIIWRNTDEFVLKYTGNLSTPMMAWSKVWPEFFKVAPFPIKGVQLNRLEM